MQIQKIFVYLHRPSQSRCGRAGQNKHRWNLEAESTVCKDSRQKRTFSERYLSVQVKLRNFESKYSGNATKRSRGCIISRLFRCYHYILMVSVCAELYNVTRRGLACVAYPYLGAMRRPDCRERRGGINSHVFFISKNLISNNAELGS